MGCRTTSELTTVPPPPDRPTPPVTTPTEVTLTNPTLYVGSFDSKLYAIDTTGNARWTYRADTAIQSSPVVAYGRVYVGSNRNHIYAVDALIQARRDRLAELEKSVATERQRAADLGRQAKSLKELVDRMGGEVTAGQRALDEARAAEAREAQAVQDKFAMAGTRDPARLAPKVRFTELRGDLPRPASGAVLRGYNQPDGRGGVTRGMSFATRPKAVVSSPADGWVSYAGPFRSYGQLLIINVGDGYYLLLAGMDRIDVAVGQFVLAGEPVAAMGDPTSAATASASPRDDDRSDPVLYVEFRKDGGSIDPEPWWARSPSEKVRG